MSSLSRIFPAVLVSFLLLGAVAMDRYPPTEAVAVLTYMWPQNANRDTTATMNYAALIPATDKCTCFTVPLYGRMQDIDNCRVRVQSPDSDDALEFAIYDSKGSQVFEDDVDVTSAGDLVLTNEIAAPGSFGPEKMWICLGADVTGSQDWDLVQFHDPQLNGGVQVSSFIEDCASGEMPATMTIPAEGSLTYSSNGEMVHFRCSDDPTS